MDEQASQISADNTAVSSQEATANQASVVPQPETAEDSREAATKKAEADQGLSHSEGGQNGMAPGKQQLKRFHDDVNDVLASKENLKLKALSIKTRPEFFREWTAESNRYLILMVNLRRRLRSGQSIDQKTRKAA